MVIDNAHVNLGVMYEQFSIFWIPMWNYGETKFVLVNDKKDTYYDLSAEEIQTLKTDFIPADSFVPHSPPAEPPARCVQCVSYSSIWQICKMIFLSIKNKSVILHFDII